MGTVHGSLIFCSHLFTYDFIQYLRYFPKWQKRLNNSDYNIFKWDFPKKSMKNILVYLCGLKEEMKYSAILGLHHALVLTFLNYLITVHSSTQDKIKLNFSDETPIPL